jgi:hypothetical protein
LTEEVVMPRARLLVLLLVAVAALSSCSGKEGPTGPRGPAGLDGANGTDGVDGNANVVVYTFGAVTFAPAYDYYFTATPGRVDSSLVLAYYQPSNFPTYWYAAPGAGPSGTYLTRSLWGPSGTAGTFFYEVLLTTSTGAQYTTPTTWNRFKIYLVPASTIIPSSVNRADYHAVTKYLNLSE